MASQKQAKWNCLIVHTFIMNETIAIKKGSSLRPSFRITTAFTWNLGSLRTLEQSCSLKEKSNDVSLKNWSFQEKQLRKMSKALELLTKKNNFRWHKLPRISKTFQLKRVVQSRFDTFSSETFLWSMSDRIFSIKASEIFSL